MLSGEPVDSPCHTGDQALKRAGDTVVEHSAGPAQLVLLAAVARRHFLDGRSKVEIAEEFGITENTAKTHHRRALMKLRQVLGAPKVTEKEESN